LGAVHRTKGLAAHQFYLFIITDSNDISLNNLNNAVASWQVNSANDCQANACSNAFPSCQYGGAVTAQYSDGNVPNGDITGTIALQTSNPDNCQAAVIDSSCSQQYFFAKTNGFISFVSTNPSTCVAGSAQQSTAHFTKGKSSCWICSRCSQTAYSWAVTSLVDFTALGRNSLEDL
jgi:hypothetical protein